MQIGSINSKNNQSFMALKVNPRSLLSVEKTLRIIINKAQKTRSDVFELLKSDSADHYYFTGKILQDPK